MGSVWLADHLTLHTQVVVKYLAQSLVDDEISRARFSKEAAAASRVKSAHVVHMLDHGVDASGLPFIVMEHLEGEDLGRRLKRLTRLPHAEVATIIGQVCRALARAHERGIVHRDIKPDNIFLCDGEDGETFVKVLDFGIAKHAESTEGNTVTGQAIGTPSFMSPEQLVGARDLDHRSDLWSVAVVAYLAMTGERPFPGGSIGAVALAVHTKPHPKPTERFPSLPPGIDAWFAKACAVEPEDRFQSARELADALADALDVARTFPRLAPDRSGEITALRSPIEPFEATPPRAPEPTLDAKAVSVRPRKRSWMWAIPALLVVPLAIVIFTATRTTPSEPKAATSKDAPPPGPEPPVTASAAKAPEPTASASVTASVSPSAPSAPVAPPTTAPPSKPATKKTSGAKSPTKPTGGYDDIE
jgi:serine/threonine-protein kinase